MNLPYDAGSDSLSIDLNARPSADSAEIVAGVVLDVGADGLPVGIDIQHASQPLDLSTLETEALPVTRPQVSQDGATPLGPSPPVTVAAPPRPMARVSPRSR